MTEIFEFIKGLVKKGLYDDGIKINISLINTKERRLAIIDPNRVPFFFEYKSPLSEISLEKIYKNEDIMVHSSDYAIDFSIYFFERFKWINPPIKNIKEIQKNFLERKI